MITLTVDLLHHCMPSATAPKIQEWAGPMRDAMATYGMNTIQRQAGLLGSVRNETGDLHATKETTYYNTPYDYARRQVFGSRMPPRELFDQWKSEGPESFYIKFFDYVYDDRIVNIGLGNVHDHDGSTYVGRGVGITGRYLYDKCGKAIGADLINNPDLLLQAKYAAPTIAFLWEDVGNNERMDRGDAYAAFKKLNPGGDGDFFAPHMAFYRHVFGVLVQASLLAAGFDPLGIDGMLGRNSGAALHAFQESRGLSASGLPDTATLAELDKIS